MHTPRPSTVKVPPLKRALGVTPAIEFTVLAVAAAIGLTTYWIVSQNMASGVLLSPAIGALLLFVNLLPAVALIILVGRRIAKRRVARMALAGGGQLHTRLVAIFSLIASVPIMLTVIAASLLFQSGVEFWLSDRARSAFDSAISIARESQRQIMSRWAAEGGAMAKDLSNALQEAPIESPAFQQYFVQQTVYRNLEESILFTFSEKNGVQTLALVEPPDEQTFLAFATPQVLRHVLSNRQPYLALAKDRVRVLAAIPGSNELFLYAGTSVNAEFLNRQLTAAEGVISGYQALQSRARVLQLQFNIVLYVVVLLILGTTVWIALSVADRLVRPVNELVNAARNVAGGDLGVRVPEPRAEDEIGTLARAFNSMTGRLETQRNDLVTANAQIESRRALIEAVMSGVSAGVISIDSNRDVRLMNESAMALLRHGEERPVGGPLREIAPELDALLDGDEREAVVQLATGGEARTLAVKITRDEGGQVLTFDDITQQLLDQRRAAWSDVARRIAHEIKNPLTPIQLAAERLQRRYGKTAESEDGTFARLTDTIIRQVGDLRRMVDEFSSFARMPKPMFREESILDIARQAMFLHEVAHPAMSFALQVPETIPTLVCDRRQIGQALTNIVKNAVEAIEGRGEGEDLPQGEILMTIAADGDQRLVLTVSDNGIGLPIERDRIVEPYMTTRSRGTGLGLAIVKRIIEEHFGTIGFADRPGGGTIVTLCFDTELLAEMAGASEAAEEGSEERPSMLTRTGNTKS
jgi:two-component system nitrogen regulation sensor histidine kinase NtrY